MFKNTTLGVNAIKFDNSYNFYLQLFTTLQLTTFYILQLLQLTTFKLWQRLYNFYVQQYKSDHNRKIL